MNILAIDPGSKCMGLYIKMAEKPGKSLSLKPDSDKRLAFFFNEIGKILEDYQIDIVFIEDYAFSRNGASQRVVAEIVGVILCQLERLDIPYIKISISIWKSYMDRGFPKKKGKAYIQAVNDYYKQHFRTADEADAAMIFWSAHCILRGMVKSEAARKIKDQFIKARAKRIETE